MNVDAWLQSARTDAARRGLEALVPLLDTLAAATSALRAADWNVPADADDRPTERSVAGAGPQVGGARARDEAVEVAPAAPPPGGSHEHSGATRSVGPHGAPELQPVSVLAPRLASGDLRARDLVEACLARIEAFNPSLNAMVAVFADRAREEASRADADLAAGRRLGPLHGVPLTVKDLVDVAGAPTTAASRVRDGLIAARDATVTTRLREAGAIILGKTNLHEFAFGTTNEDSAFGPVRHPTDHGRSPGGSSGGSAAAIRAGMGLASIGTDTGGSIRIPAAACGLVGLKPTFGEVPTDGVVPLAWSLDHVGPLARTVDDAWLLLDVLRGRSPRADPRSERRPRELRLALLEPYFCDHLQEGVARAFSAALDELARGGVRVSSASIAHAPLIGPVYLHTVLAEAAAYHGPTLDRRPQDYTAPVRVRLDMAGYVLGEDYVRAARGRAVLTREVDDLLAGIDALVLPTLPIAAPRLGEPTVDLGGRPEAVRNAMLRLTQLFDLTGHPSITLPIGDAEPGLPAGLQLVGHRAATDELMATALACEHIVRAW